MRQLLRDGTARPRSGSERESSVVGGGGGGGTPAWLPAGAVVFAGFSAGHYYANGAETTVNSALAEDSSNWQFFDTADITPGVGYVTTSNRGPVIVHSALGTLLTAGFTAVVDFDTNASSARVLVEVTDFPDYAAEFSASLHTDTASDDYSLQSATESASEALGMTEGSHKLAFTFKSDGSVAVSRDGATALTLASGAAPSAATDIGFTFDSLIVRSITIYPPQLDADLPALSYVAPTFPTAHLTNRWSMNPAHVSGATLTPDVGSITGTLQTQFEVTAGTDGLYFSGAGWIEMSAASLPNPPHSLSVWFKELDFTWGAGGTFTTLAGINSANGSTTRLVCFNTNPNYYIYLVVWNAAGDYAEYQSIAQVTTTGFHHIAYTWDGTAAPVVYLDGAPFAMQGGENSGLGRPLGNFIGGREANTALIQGELFDLCTFDAVLSADDIATIYGLGR